jgi:hypothetical protein
MSRSFKKTPIFSWTKLGDDRSNKKEWKKAYNRKFRRTTSTDQDIANGGQYRILSANIINSPHEHKCWNGDRVTKKDMRK